MTEITLYHNDMSVCAAKVRMALAEKGVGWDGVHLDIRAGDAQKPEYVALNPNMVVPTLVHRGRVIIESNIICEYIEDAWPQGPLRPADPFDTARMRLWMKQLDDGVHAATGTVSMCIAFRHQYLKRSPAEFQAYLDKIPDPARRDRVRNGVERGMDAAGFAPAVKRFAKLVADMDKALADQPWLAGPTFSLADLAYASYMIRLAHLGLDDMVTARPRVADWRTRLFARDSYREGIERWFNPAYLDLFAQHAGDARGRARDILAAS